MGHIKKAHRHDSLGFTTEFFYRNHIFVSAFQYSATVFFEILCEGRWTWSSIFFSVIIRHSSPGLKKEVALLDTVILIQYSAHSFSVWEVTVWLPEEKKLHGLNTRRSQKLWNTKYLPAQIFLFMCSFSPLNTTWKIAWMDHLHQRGLTQPLKINWKKLNGLLYFVFTGV